MAMPFPKEETQEQKRRRAFAEILGLERRKLEEDKNSAFALGALAQQTVMLSPSVYLIAGNGIQSHRKITGTSTNSSTTQIVAESDARKRNNQEEIGRSMEDKKKQRNMSPVCFYGKEVLISDIQITPSVVLEAFTGHHEDVGDP